MATVSESDLTFEHSSGRLAVGGEIDAENGARLAHELEAASDQDLRLDMSEVDFIDSSGLRVLISAHQRFEAQGHVLTIVEPSTAVLRVLQLAALETYLNVDG